VFLVKENEMGRTCSTHGGVENEKYEKNLKKPCQGLRNRWESNVKVDVRETECEVVDWIGFNM
jgi:hypothetical protein